MAEIEVSRIQHRRGLRKDLPEPLNAGELGYCIDTGQLFLGPSEDYTKPVIAGATLDRLAPADGINLANELKNRVMVCDIATDFLDYTESDLEEIIVSADLYSGIDIGSKKVSTTIVVKNIPVGDGTIYQRAYVGIFKQDENDDQIDLALVSSRLKAIQHDGNYLFVQDAYNVTAATGSFFKDTGLYAKGRFNNTPIEAIDYQGIAWAINHIYFFVGSASSALVNSATNVEIITEASFDSYINDDTRDNIACYADLLPKDASTEMEIYQVIDVGEEGAPFHIDPEKAIRSFSVDYSLMADATTSVEEYAATGNMKISLVINPDNTGRLGYDDNFSATESQSGEVSIVPYHYYDSEADVHMVKFNYINTLDPLGSGRRTVRFKTYAIQWSNF